MDGHFRLGMVNQHKHLLTRFPQSRTRQTLAEGRRAIGAVREVHVALIASVTTAACDGKPLVFAA